MNVTVLMVSQQYWTALEANPSGRARKGNSLHSLPIRNWRQAMSIMTRATLTLSGAGGQGVRTGRPREDLPQYLRPLSARFAVHGTIEDLGHRRFGRLGPCTQEHQVGGLPELAGGADR